MTGIISCDYETLLAEIAPATDQLFAQILIYNAILFVNTSPVDWSLFNAR